MTHRSCEPATPAVDPNVRQQQLQGGRMQPKPRIGALILIVLGVLFLLSNLGWIPRLGPLFAQWWPVILIVVGVSLLVRR
jgi:hypothetical protein